MRMKFQKSKELNVYQCLFICGMNNFKEVLVALEMVKKKEKNEKKSKRWAAFLGAVVVVLLATALTSTRTASKLNLSLFFKNPNSCHCPQDSKGYTGIVEDCCCDYETVDSVNAEVLHPLLQEIVKTLFFIYFKAKLWCDCPFWTEDGMCLLRDCSICECPENEFPESFMRPLLQGLAPDSFVCQEGKQQGTVDWTLDSRAFRGWVETDNPWTNDDETDNGEMTYVNLLLNPERYWLCWSITEKDMGCCVF
ncbi:hypothetical protein PRUPE_4G145500 [Prunus persica]|uniref:Uncharacterized protein n=1 Tax=Prunus persica TaxID=3760 RepID=A0A251PKJ7_PRUPE|nr:hypothetical protein PRUPE_4G145500 [Prunus persica]